MNDLLNSLNGEQKKAVLATDGPLIILAGAGSGKTRVLVHKVLYLIGEKGVSADAILMVTFTNKAAGEMRERITHLLSTLGFNAAGRPTVGTFHALCAKILRIDGKHIGIPNHFVIYDDVDQQEAVKQAMLLLDIPTKNIRPRSALETISGAKNQMITPENYASFARGYFQEAVAKIYPVYQNILRQNYALDFDDLLLETIRLFKTVPYVLTKYQQKFKYILVDEYQDTNHAQYLLTRLLAGQNRNICIVGDFAQSIYSFRGADFRNLEKFQQDFPDAQVFPLSQNYRSTQKILNAAYKVISHNTLHPVLSLWTQNPEGDEIMLLQAEDEHNEAEFIIQAVHERMKNDANFSFKDVAVLYRMNAQSRALEETFLHHSIPYVLVGGTRFYARKEIKDVLSYLSYLANPNNAIALARIEKIGKRKMHSFLEYTRTFLQDEEKDQKTTIEILDEALKASNYLSLYDEKDPEDRSRLENIRELRSVAIEFPQILAFLENVALVEQEQLPDRLKRDGEKPDAITLMTLHAAKGLEFKMVFMVGMEEGLFPHSQSLFDQQDLEEERRLCYVGITRAKEKLIMTFAKNRLFFGQRVSGTISRFVYELPEEVLEENDIDKNQDEPSFL